MLLFHNRDQVKENSKLCSEMAKVEFSYFKMIESGILFKKKTIRMPFLWRKTITIRFHNTNRWFLTVFFKPPKNTCAQILLMA